MKKKNRQADFPPVTLLVVTGAPMSGRSTVAANLAWELALNAPVRIIVESEKYLKKFKYSNYLKDKGIIRRISVKNAGPVEANGLEKILLKYGRDGGWIIVVMNRLPDLEKLESFRGQGMLILVHDSLNSDMADTYLLLKQFGSQRRSSKSVKLKLRLDLIINRSRSLKESVEIYRKITKYNYDFEKPLHMGFLGPVFDAKGSIAGTSNLQIPLSNLAPDSPFRGCFAYMADKLEESLKSFQDQSSLFSRFGASLPGSFNPFFKNRDTE